MAKLYFRYGAMGSSKTANALMVRFNYLEKGKKVEFLKPDIENRDGEMIVRSRIGLEAECKYVSVFLKEFLSSPYELDAIIIDEAISRNLKRLKNLAILWITTISLSFVMDLEPIFKQSYFLVRKDFLNLRI